MVSSQKLRLSIRIDPTEVQGAFIIFGKVVDARISNLFDVILDILNMVIFKTVLSISPRWQLDPKVDLNVFRICCAFL